MTNTPIIPPKKGDKSTTLHIKAEPEKLHDTIRAELAFGGVANSTALAMAFSKSSYGELSLNACMAVLETKVDAIHKGNLNDAEALLISQAFALDAVFASLAHRAQLNMGEYINAAERYMRLALKAQGQCRATLETLAAMKNPPVVIAKQANIAGAQQVNNNLNVTSQDLALGQTSCAGNFNFNQNELLEQQHEQRVEFRTARKTG